MGFPGHDPTIQSKGRISLSSDECLQLCTATKLISPDPSPFSYLNLNIFMSNFPHIIVSLNLDFLDVFQPIITNHF